MLCKVIRLAVRETLAFEDFREPAEVSVTLTDNARIQKLNRRFRGKDAPTDVLSFPMLGDDPDGDLPVEGYLPLGDMVLSLERAMEQASEFPHTEAPEGCDPFLCEVAFLCIHSTLHLLGYDHETSPEDEKEMFARQEEIMRAFAKRHGKKELRIEESL